MIGETNLSLSYERGLVSIDRMTFNQHEFEENFNRLYKPSRPTGIITLHRCHPTNQFPELNLVVNILQASGRE